MTQAVQEHREGIFARLIARWREQSELSQLPAGELDRVAGELGMTGEDLASLALKGPHASDLLYERMAALGITRDDADRLAHGLMRDLERSCACCADKGQCKGDLAQHPDDPVWKEYCPNAITLESLRRMKGRAVI
ncbi:MAG: hypothetical protein NW223_06830 [Hyphomicrobiaceae bacterium]|nr:hypothetical protein [Hyphomicrobiaceae bacterium]